MRSLVIAVGLTILGSGAHAQASAEQVARCAVITDPAKRLECYDGLAKPKADTSSATAAALPAGAKRIENWIMLTETDPITDTKGVSFALEAEGATSVDTPTLMIRCKRGELDVIVSPDEYLGDGNNRVTVRLGTDPPMQQRWTESANHTVLFVPGDRARVEAFVRTLARYERVAIQVTPYNKGPMAMVFQLAGIGQVNQELWAICAPKAK